ncbi:MAG: hypothetical protein ACRDID_17650 [Ktedonobacterales bacterium]
MSASERHGAPDEAPTADRPAALLPRTPRPRPAGRGLRRGLGLLAALIALAIVGALAYNGATSYFALNGAWYGPLRLQVGPGRVSLEAYMDVATYLSGSLSGSGKLCYRNPLGGGTTSIDVAVTGTRNAGQVTISFATSTAAIGIPVLNVAIGPELVLHGGFTTSPPNTGVAGILVNGAATALTLSGGTSAFPMALDMRRGGVTRFAAACASGAATGPDKIV